MAVPTQDISGYRYGDAAPSHTHSYLLPSVLNALGALNFPSSERRVFDLGCGNGSTASRLAKAGYDVTGVDPSEEGIRQAHKSYPNIDLHLGSAYDDLADRFGHFPAIVSLEVVEHVYAPRAYAQTLYDLLAPGGLAIVSTPYHGYWKNLLIALTNSYDQHHNPLWDHGHIKFWSIDTLDQLLRETGFTDISFERVGRVPPLAKSMIATARKPSADAAS
jgi:2-polyprenyl-6-hydroxyphenyl methylase/3-demethylubiquinone-9 3-methyltransferase